MQCAGIIDVEEHKPHRIPSAKWREVIDRAGEILQNLEEGEFSDKGQPKIAEKRQRKGREDKSQLDLFG